MTITANGCTCHMIQVPGEEHRTCISCQGRQKMAARGHCCKQCKIGIWDVEGDHEGMDGLCTSCYYNE